MTYEQLMNVTSGTFLGFFETGIVIEVLGVTEGIIRYKYVLGPTSVDRQWGVDPEGDPDCFVLTELMKELL